MSSVSPMPANAFVDFKQLKAHVSISQVLERYDLMRTLKRSGDRLSGPCPLHRGTNPTQFRVSVSKNCWNCFGSCGRGGNVIDLVSLREAVPFRDAALLLQEWFMPEGLSNETKVSEPAPRAPARPPSPPGERPQRPAVPAHDSSDDETEAGENPPLSFELKSLKRDHPYLAERGIAAATVESYGIGYCSKGCLKGYVAIPIRNREGKLVSYIGRWPGKPEGDTPKYKLPKGFKKSLELFNLDRAAAADASQPLLVVEGIFDCLRLVQFGYTRTVALLGSSLSKRQESLLRDTVGKGGRIHLLLDADDAGRKGAQEAASRLCTSCLVRVIDIEAFGPQPDFLTENKLRALLD